MILSDGEVGFDQSAVLDMQVAAARRTESCTSATTANQSDADFWETIRSRDERCVFTRWHGEACHIIPHTQGDEVSYFAYGVMRIACQFCDSADTNAFQGALYFPLYSRYQ